MSEFIKTRASKISLARRGLMHGVGVNDAWYATTAIIDGKRVPCPSYLKWRNMLERCYSARYQEKKPTYIGCSVCPEWLTFSNFAEWFEAHNIDGYQLDKDIIKKGNKIYSPETCIYVPQCINLLLIDNAARRGDHPVGVCLDTRANKYKSSIRIDSKTKHLGNFSTPELARNAYIKAKNKEIKRKCEQYPEFAKYLINHLIS